MRALLAALNRPLPISNDAVETLALVALFAGVALLRAFGLFHGGAA